MISIIFWILAAICNAIMDTCSHHFPKSVFSKYPYFWNTENSWKNKYVNWPYNADRRKVKIWNWKFNYPVQLTDSFHLFKMLMIVFICLSIVFFEPTPGHNWIWKLLVFVIYGIVWNLIFNLFYNHILIKKK